MQRRAARLPHSSGPARPANADGDAAAPPPPPPAPRAASKRRAEAEAGDGGEAPPRRKPGSSGAAFAQEPCALGRDDRYGGGAPASAGPSRGGPVTRGGAAPPTAAGAGAGPGRRPLRIPGGLPEDNPRLREFLAKLRRGAKGLGDAGGRVLRLKRFVSADARHAALDAVLDALALNTRVQVLYIQARAAAGRLEPRGREGRATPRAGPPQGASRGGAAPPRPLFSPPRFRVRTLRKASATTSWPS